MSSISKLSIRGVRAFSPEADEQTVEFHTPITIITGANGCGKTTIIEALKYAVSGCMPPGCERGKAFVHDPRSIQQSLVKANVKLRFTSKANRTMVVVRSMEVTQKKTNMTFKQMDGILRTMNADGQRVSASSKCNELDKQMASLLGVQRPILEHVLFCHQEEASWPLLDGAALKKRFDEIFDSSKYTKAIDIYKKQEKELVSKSKDLKADLAALQSHKHAASGFRKELQEVNEQIEVLDEQKKEIKQAIADAEKEIAKQAEISAKAFDLEDECSQLQAQRDQLKSGVTKQRSLLEEDLTAQPVQELKTMLHDFDEKRSGEVEKLETMLRERGKLDKTISELREKEMRLNNDMGKQAAAKEAYENNIKARNSKIQAIVERYKIDTRISQTQLTSFSASQSVLGGETQDTVTSTLSPADVEELRNALKRSEETMEEEHKSRRAGVRAEQETLRASLTDIGGRLKAIESERAKLLDKKNEAEAERKNLSKGATHHSMIRKSDIEEARKLAKQAAEEREAASKDPQLRDIPNQVKLLERKIEELKGNIDEDSVLLNSLRDSAQALDKVSLLKDQSGKELEALEESLREQSYSLQKYSIQRVQPLPGKDGGDDNGDELRAAMLGIHNSVQDKYDAATRELSKSKEAQAKAQQSVSEATAFFVSRQQQLHGLAQKLTDLKKPGGPVSKVETVVEQIRRSEQDGGALSVDAPRELLKFIDDKLAGVKEELSVDDPAVLKAVVKKVIKHLKDLMKQTNDDDNNMTCPCCKTELVDKEDVQRTKDNLSALKKELSKVDDAALENARNLERKYQSWRNVVVENSDGVKEAQRLKEESTVLEKEIRRYEEDKKRHQRVADDQNAKTVEVQTEVDDIRELLDAANRWVADGHRIADHKIEIVQKLSDLSSSGAAAGDDLKTVERRREKRTEEKEALANKMNRLNKDMSQLNEHIATLRDKSDRLDRLARDKEAKFADEQKASTRKAELLELLEEYGKEDKKLSDEIAPLKQKLRLKESEQSRLQHVADDEARRMEQTRMEFANDKNSLEELNSRIESYVASDKLQGLDIIRSQLSEVQGRINDTRKILVEKKPELDRLRNAVSDQERHKKQLVQNIEVLETEAKIQVLDSKTAALKADISNIEGYATCEDLSAEANELKVKKLAEKARAEGRASELWQQMTALKRKLKTDEYKNVEERTRVAGIKYETTKIAAEDVKTFYTSLDKALLEFHQVKIKEINKIIRELWLMTYKGEDITNIELRSGQEPGSKAAKSYNYRLVMTKGNATMDMRGRCSAGQRVLASIVIRVALAETFGVDCGCLALDEPTVNLDEKNKKGLAVALAQIVASRASQRNFQLILITHDEDFVSMMKTELSCLTGFSMPDSFFRVRRELETDGKYYSKIDKVDFDELV